MSNLKLFESKHIRSIWNEAEQKWYFSVQDVVLVLTDSSDIKQYIKRILSRDEQLKNNWGTICTLVEMKAADALYSQGQDQRTGAIDLLVKQAAILRYQDLEKQSGRSLNKSILIVLLLFGFKNLE